MAKRSEKTSFSLTCSLLSQYIRENGSIADLGIAAPASRTTMSLLSGIDASGDGAKEGFSSHNAARSMDLFPQHKSPEDSQLTIFYGGKVLVFDNFPAERANDLMQIASKGQSFPARPRPSFSDLPIARSASLHRFLQKRRAR
nr:jasmonate ZIM domain protein 3 [Gastrodia elata]